MNSDKSNGIITGDNNDRGVTSSSTLSFTSSTSTSPSYVQQQEQQQQQPQQLLQPVQSQPIEDKNKSSNGQIIKSSLSPVGTEENVTVVRMRNRPLSQIQEQVYAFFNNILGKWYIFKSTNIMLCFKYDFNKFNINVSKSFSKVGKEDVDWLSMEEKNY